MIKVLNTDKASGERTVFANIFVRNRKFLLNILDSASELGIGSFSKDLLVKGVKEYRIFAYMQEGYFANIDSISNYYITTVRKSSTIGISKRIEALFANEI